MAARDVAGLTTDQRNELRSTAISFLEAKAGSAELRRMVASADGDQRLWNEICELGWLALEVPEDHGGVSGRFADLAILLEALGRLMTPVPFMSATVLGIAALRRADVGLRELWLPRLSSGEYTATAALTGPLGDLGTISVDALSTGDGWTLHGVSGYVPDARRAGAIAVAARRPGSKDPTLFVVEADAPGISIRPLKTVDVTRQVDEVTFQGVRVTEEDALGEFDYGTGLRDELLDRAAMAIACDAAAGAQRLLEITLEHLRTREQFGRPVGSFQALKHRCVNMHLRVESARTASFHAAAAAEDPIARPVAASIAKAVAADAYEFVAAEAVQLHGGVGFTEEYDPHLHLKRARLNAALFGTSAWHRDRIARFGLEAVEWT